MPSARAFCPTNFESAGDGAVKQACRTVLHLPDTIGPVLTGDAQSLQAVDPNGKLYIICHGHEDMPLFNVGKERWTAKDMADLLVSCGLKKDHREIVMLVCHAGQTLGDEAVINQRVALQATYDKVKGAKGKKAELKRADTLKRFDTLQDQASPTNFTDKKQVLPMVAQLIDELKARKYDFIRMQAFLGPVNATLTNGIRVKVGGRYEAASDANTVNWL